MIKVTVFVSAILFFLSSLCFAQGEQDSITITTYYPSPYGVYKTLRLFPGDRPTPCKEGEIFYDDGILSGETGLYYCDSSLSWQPIGGGAGGYWDASGDDIYNTNTDFVGIGTPTPSNRLSVVSEATNKDGLLVTGGSYFTTHANSGGVTLGHDPAANGHLIYHYNASDLYLINARRDIGADIVLRTNNIDVLRATTTASGGRVGIGTAVVPGYKLDVVGDVGANAYYYRSDIALKENINPLKNTLERITKMNGVSFNWKESGEGSIGLIAQEVEKIFPEVVATRNNSKSIDYAKLIAPLIEAVKEQQVQIERLKAKINQLGIKN